MKSELKLISLLNQKHNKGYEFLYRNYYSALCNFCFRFIQNKEEAEDIVQDIILKLWKNNVNFYSEQSLSSYLFVSARNASINSIKKKSKFLGSDSYNELLDILKDDKTIQHIIIEEEFNRQIYSVINKLSPERRQVVLLSMEGLSNNEIAVKTGVSVNTVKTLKLKAYRYLRNELQYLLHFDFIS